MNFLILYEIEMGILALALVFGHKFPEAAIACVLIPVIEELRRLIRRQL